MPKDQQQIGCAHNLLRRTFFGAPLLHLYESRIIWWHTLFVLSLIHKVFVLESDGIAMELTGQQEEGACHGCLQATFPPWVGTPRAHHDLPNTSSPWHAVAWQGQALGAASCSSKVAELAQVIATPEIEIVSPWAS